MKKRIWKVLGSSLLAILALAVFTQVFVSAQVNDGDEGMVGSWDVEVTIRNCENGTPLFGFPANITFNQGGTLTESDLGPPVVTSLPAQGVWSHMIGRGYSAAYRRLTFAPDRTFIGTGVVRSSITLARGGDAFNATDTFIMLDPGGNPIPGSAACATEVGTRFR